MSAPMPPLRRLDAPEGGREREAISVLDLMARLPLWFKGESWDAWRALLAALFGQPMTEAQLALYRKHTGRTMPPTAPAREAYLTVGRRGGKSLAASLVALWAAAFRSYAGILSPGESAVVMIVASDRRQARVIFRYIAAFFAQVPGLAALVRGRTQEALHLTNGISIEIHTCSFRAVRGPTVVAFIADELAYWRDETSASPDREVLDAIRPAQLTVREPVFLCISSPYARRGELWRAYATHFGKEGDHVFVWAADTLSMNPTVPPEVIADAFEQDEAVAWAEYGRDGEIRFRSDVETFVSRETVEACVVAGRALLPPVEGMNYVAFCDPAGGSGADSFTWAIAHAEERDGRRVVVVDSVQERRPPFSPMQTVRESAAHVKVYRISTIVGDRFGGDWPGEQYRAADVHYEPSEATKSEIYSEVLPLLVSGLVELPDEPKLVAQFVGLERRVARGGRSSVDHGPGNAHDDVCNAVSGAIRLVTSGRRLEPARLW